MDGDLGSFSPEDLLCVNDPFVNPKDPKDFPVQTRGPRTGRERSRGGETPASSPFDFGGPQ